MLPDILLPCSSNGKEPACSAGDLGSIPGLEDPLEKGMAAHCGLLDGESQGEEPGGSQPVRSQSGTWLSYTHTHTHTRTHRPTQKEAVSGVWCIYWCSAAHTCHPSGGCHIQCLLLLPSFRSSWVSSVWRTGFSHRLLCGILLHEYTTVYSLISGNSNCFSLKTVLLRVSSMGSAAGLPWLLWINNWAQNCWLAHMPILSLSGCLQIVLQSCLIWFFFF